MQKWYDINTMFQSTPPHGGRHIPDFANEAIYLFQSTPPHGGRPKFSQLGGGQIGFNPRPRTGGDCF